MLLKKKTFIWRDISYIVDKFYVRHIKSVEVVNDNQYAANWFFKENSERIFVLYNMSAGYQFVVPEVTIIAFLI